MSLNQPTYSEIHRSQLWKVEGELYELVDFRVTQVKSPIDFITTAFFKSKDPNSELPRFEEKIKTIISEPHIYKPYTPAFTPKDIENVLKKVLRKESLKTNNKPKVSSHKIGLEKWLQTVPKPSGRLYNILRRLCLKEFNDERKDISPLDITKEEFLSLKQVGIRSWEDFEALRNING